MVRTTSRERVDAGALALWMPVPVYAATLILALVSTAVCSVNQIEVYQFDGFDVLMIGFIFIGRHLGGHLAPVRVVLQVAEACLLMAYVIEFWVPMAYAVQVFRFPLWDESFQAFDRALGGDYPALMAWMSAHPLVYKGIERIYNTYGLILPLAFLFGLWIRPEMQIGARFYVSMILASLLSTALWGLFPCYGAVVLLDPETARGVVGATPVDMLAALRGGMLHDVPPGKMSIISFPSMHVGGGLLLLCCLRRSKMMLLAFAPFALGYVVTARISGAHYYADMLAAVPMVLVCMVLTDGLFRLCTAVRISDPVAPQAAG